ncbi:MAG: hypothetical protein V3V28_00185 [Polaribacter sp.]|uniref:hypothetical protein n=1 Tax=Polaribacter sp. TaxID=1920175 RepID=UPI002F359C15
MYSVNSRKPNYYVLEENEKEFLTIDLFPSSKEKIKISKIEDNGKLVPAQLYPQFFPNEVPKLKQEYVLFKGTKKGQIETKNNMITTSLNEVQ